MPHEHGLQIEVKWASNANAFEVNQCSIVWFCCNQEQKLAASRNTNCFEHTFNTCTLYEAKIAFVSILQQLFQSQCLLAKLYKPIIVGYLVAMSNKNPHLLGRAFNPSPPPPITLTPTP